MKCKEYKKVAVVLGLLCVLAVAATWGQRVIRDGTIERKEAGEGSRIENISAYVDGQKYDMTVEVGERKLTEEETQKLFKKAEKEIDKTFLGANESPEKITKPIVMKESYQEGMVEATWYLDRFDAVDTEGNLIREKISSAGTAVNAQVWLSYQEYQEVYRFSFMVYPPKLTTQEKIEEALQEAEKETPVQPYSSQEMQPIQDTRLRMADLENISLTFNKEESYDYIGSESGLANLDVQKAVSDMRKDSVLQEYQYFVGSAQALLRETQDGIVIPKPAGLE